MAPAAITPTSPTTPASPNRLVHDQEHGLAVPGLDADQAVLDLSLDETERLAFA